MVCILGLKQLLPCQSIQKSSFLEQIMDIVQKLFILKLDPEPEKLCEHGAWSCANFTCLFY